MTIKIDLKALGYKNPVKLNESIRNVKEVLNFQKLIGNIDLTDEQYDKLNAIDKGNYYIDREIKTMNYTVNFVKDILNLSEKNGDKLNDLSFKDVQSIADNITSQMLKLDQEQDSSDKGKK